MGTPSAEWGETVTAYLVAPATLTAKELREFLGESLAAYKHPRIVHHVDSLPHNALGKVQKHRLAEGREIEAVVSRLARSAGEHEFDVATGTPVRAVADGRVRYAGRFRGYGNTVILDHGFGIRTHYGHNDKLLVKKGERVERGQAIAQLGSTGRSTGPHLHYTVEVRGKAVNPLDYIFD